MAKTARLAGAGRERPRGVEDPHDPPGQRRADRDHADGRRRPRRQRATRKLDQQAGVLRPSPPNATTWSSQTSSAVVSSRRESTQSSGWNQSTRDGQPARQDSRGRRDAPGGPAHGRTRRAGSLLTSSGSRIAGRSRPTRHGLNRNGLRQTVGLLRFIRLAIAAQTPRLPPRPGWRSRGASASDVPESPAESQETAIPASTPRRPIARRRRA